MSLLTELKRRNVIRVAIAYIAGAWLLTEVSGTLFPAFGIPDWGVRFVVIVLALGFLPALIISWAYELTPDGLKREKDVVREASITHFTAKRLDGITIGLIVVAIVFIWADRFWLSPSNSGQIAAPAEVVTDTAQTEPQYPHNSIAVLPIVNMSEDTGPPQPMLVARVQLPFPEGEGLLWKVGTVFAMSPDGTQLVYVGPAEAGQQLWLRSLDAPNATPIPGTDGAQTPFFSPNGQFVAFRDGRTGALRIVSTSGSPPIMLVEHTGSTAGDWGPDERVYFGSVGGGISRVSASGGEAEVVTRPDTSRGELEHSTVDVLPNGKGALITIWHGEIGDAEIAVVEFNTGAVRVLGLGSHPLYAQSGHLVYVRDDGVLLAAPFDQNTLELQGSPTSLTETVAHKGYGQWEFSVSETGTLLRIDSRSSVRQPVWVGRDGVETTIDPDWKGEFYFPALSPDGTRLALSVDRPELLAPRHIWIKTLAGGPPSQLTFEGSNNQPPVWSLDGQRVMYSSTIDGVRGFREQQADGSDTATLVLALEFSGQSMGWSEDGRWLVYQRLGSVRGFQEYDIFGYQPDLGSPPVPLVATGFSERNPALSPKGRWLAYESNRSGRFEVYVKPFPNVDDPERKVSADGGFEPSWAHNRQELFYKNGDNELVVVEYETDPSFRTLTENSLFSLEGFYLTDVFNHSYAVDVDDDRFLMLKAISDPNRSVLMTFNFFEELKQRVGGGND
jgi:serine/threonine-protein kinase